MASIIISLLYLIFMRRAIYKGSLDLDMDALTPSDFCLMGRNMVFESYAPKDMREAIVKAFSERYGVAEEDIVYINFAYNIGKFYQYTNKFHELSKKEMLIKAYCQANEGMDEEKYKKMCEDPDNCPKDFPKEKVGLFRSKIINLTDVRGELQAVQEAMKEMENDATIGDDDEQDASEKFTKVCFVVVSKPAVALKVLR